MPVEHASSMNRMQVPGSSRIEVVAVVASSGGVFFSATSPVAVVLEHKCLYTFTKAFSDNTHCHIFSNFNHTSQKLGLLGFNPRHFFGFSAKFLAENPNPLSFHCV